MSKVEKSSLHRITIKNLAYFSLYFMNAPRMWYFNTKSNDNFIFIALACLLFLYEPTFPPRSPFSSEPYKQLFLTAKECLDPTVRKFFLTSVLLSWSVSSVYLPGPLASLNVIISIHVKFNYDPPPSQAYRTPRVLDTSISPVYSDGPNPQAKGQRAAAGDVRGSPSRPLRLLRLPSSVMLSLDFDVDFFIRKQSIP